MSEAEEAAAAPAAADAGAEGAESRRRCFLDIDIEGQRVGRIVVELFYDAAPRACENFRCLCTGEKGHVPDHPTVPMHYKGSTFHRVIPGFMVHGGDYTAGDGTGGWSIWGDSFADEPFTHNHDGAGYLAMANCGPNTNCSQFYITCVDCPHLNGKHVVFGKVLKGMSVVRAIEHTQTGTYDKPVVPVVIADCGDLASGEDDGTPERQPGDKYEDYPQDMDPPLNDAMKVTAGTEIKAEGNELFKAQSYKAAIAKYSKALRYLSAARPEPHLVDEINKQKVACFSNTAQCHLKLQQWSEARLTSWRGLTIEPNNAKVLFRHATALYELKMFDDARKWAAKAAQEAPEDKATQQLLGKLKSVKQAETKQRAAAARAWIGS
eukprot:TRINITY_DN1004_c4_g1_i1.p1 TRINITY_DN1004_c4_g1~~TRINITY_DN1004_c4_g1_i1.p1  ORF type:complete len:400 (+),score=132.25 TRINITY_DN1004_c4_g1_i1:65-1201(+)